MDRGAYRGCCGGEVSEEGWEVVDVGVDLERIELRWREARALSGVCVFRRKCAQSTCRGKAYRRVTGDIRDLLHRNIYMHQVILSTRRSCSPASSSFSHTPSCERGHRRRGLDGARLGRSRARREGIRPVINVVYNDGLFIIRCLLTGCSGEQLSSGGFSSRRLTGCNLNKLDDAGLLIDDRRQGSK